MSGNPWRKHRGPGLPWRYALIGLLTLIGLQLLLTGCGEMPQAARDREQREDSIRWLERQEIKRQQLSPHE